MEASEPKEKGVAGAPARPSLSERDVSYLKLLKTLKAAGGPTEASEGQLGVVRRIATWIDSLPVLNFIAAHAPWYDDWEVKEGLLHNDLTPTRFRRELEKAIAIFDLLRELDDPSLTEQDQREIKEDVRYLIKTLAERDRAVVKQRALLLSASRGDVPGAGPVAAVAAAAEAAPVAEAVEPEADDLLALEVADSIETGELPVAASVTQAIHDAEARAWSEPAASEAMPGSDLLAAEHEEASAPAETAWEEAAGRPVEPVAAEPAGTAGLEEEATAGGLPSSPRERAILAEQTTEPAVMMRLAHDRDESVQVALVTNPAVTDGAAAIVARHAGSRAAEAIHRNRRLFSRPLVQRALLECPQATSGALLEIVNTLGSIEELLTVIANPKVKFLEVKAKARARLGMRFKALGVGEKVATIRRSGRRILKELWTDFFRDEALVIRCLQERQVDEGTVHEIARSKVAPRKALELIGSNAAWTNNYQIRLDLVMNPKTPRQVVTRLIRKLNPADRKMVKSNPSIPESVRRLA